MRKVCKIVALLSMLLASASCTSAANPVAICDGSSRLRTDHAAALAADGGDRSVVTGARLIAAIDAGCQQ